MHISVSIMFESTRKPEAKSINHQKESLVHIAKQASVLISIKKRFSEVFLETH